jgi:cytochrome c biogenesis factor
MVNVFIYLAFLTIFLLLLASFFSLKNKRSYVNKLMLIFILIWLVWLVLLWIEIDRAPIRTLGETRMWYAFLSPVIAWALFQKYKWKWIIPYSSLISIVFLIINVIFLENFAKELLPALQSIWFVPHVLVYMFAYAMFGVTTLISAKVLWFKKDSDFNNFTLTIDRLIYTGFAFLTLGLLFGAIWAKEAWGHYWTWDPKEVWAMITCLSYLLYIHYSKLIKSEKINAYILITAFVFLLICWFGINYLPIAKESIHTY